PGRGGAGPRRPPPRGRGPGPAPGGGQAVGRGAQAAPAGALDAGPVALPGGRGQRRQQEDASPRRCAVGPSPGRGAGTPEEPIRSRKDLDMSLSKSRKRSKRLDPSDPLVQRVLDPLAEALAQPDERSREAAVERVAQLHVPVGTGVLTEALVELLGREE